MTPTPPKLFDAAQVQMHRDRAAGTYGEYDFLKRRESSQLIERLEDVSRTFQRALDFGAHDGTATEMLAAHPQVAAIEALEASPRLRALAMARGVEARGIAGETFGLPDATYDLVTSVLALHWVNDLPGALIQIRQALKPDGLFLGCLFGAGTLSELRTSLIEAETELTGGAAPRVSPLPGLQDMAGLMQRAGFALPVVDLETVTVRYGDPFRLLADLKGMGEQAAFAANEKAPRRPLSPRILARMAEIYAERFADPDGRLRATFNVVWLSGWAPDASQPKPLRPGSAKHSLADAVRKAGKR
ncbi:methyltransferase domain-containing protein [Henriciella pelagia]|jgi:SAM-dependent methyltransferase|uniref:SAM-dependent methyltransferase n=1 Tax=Henriciella pelagia TaxID=1977912 RepID=A0ABQ1JMU9_9PROT|nr:methyltransferase domain-containing protein [Henriciella pelagia]GGB73056.1 SAM-dependent methyltransferase [Henriciella pelagia]